MSYYRLKQDRRYKPFPILKDIFEILPVHKVSRANNLFLEDRYGFYIEYQPETMYPSVLDFQRFLIRKDIQKIFRAFDPQIIYKHCCLLDIPNEQYSVYYLPLFQELDCLHSTSIHNLDKSKFTKIVLEKNKIRHKRIFKIANIKETIIVISLDVLESLLRRHLFDFTYEKLEIR